MTPSLLYCRRGQVRAPPAVVAAALLPEKPFTAVDGMMRASNIMDSKTSGDTSGVNWFKENRHRNDANKIIYEAVAP